MELLVLIYVILIVVAFIRVNKIHGSDRHFGSKNLKAGITHRSTK